MSRFYFTIHPGDMLAERLLDGCSALLVASAHWDPERQRFKVRRPPACVASIAVDSGGFTAARRWGRYPWTLLQYVDFIGETARDHPLDFCAEMDYACERGVDRSALATNRERIEATIANDAALRALAPGLPWLSVLQGNTLAERAFDLARRRTCGLLPTEYAGIGSVCGRSPREAQQVVRFYQRELLGVQYHGFGLHVQVLDADDVYWSIRSWDSYSWTWGRGQKAMDRPAELYRQPGETYSALSRRLAEFYQREVITPRLTRPRQAVLVQ